MNHIELLVNDPDYSVWSDRIVIADYFRELGLSFLSKKMINLPIKREILIRFLNIIMPTVNKVKHNELFEELYFTGLIYS